MSKSSPLSVVFERWEGDGLAADVRYVSVPELEPGMVYRAHRPRSGMENGWVETRIWVNDHTLTPDFDDVDGYRVEGSPMSHTPAWWRFAIDPDPVTFEAYAAEVEVARHR